MSNPTISVIIPAYRQAGYLGVAIESALSQSVPPLEVLVVDDASPDDTPSVCARYGEAIRYWRKARNRGVSAARNTALAQARGEFVQFLDADDFLPPDTFELHARAVERCPGGGVYYGGAYLMDREGAAMAPVVAYRLSEDPFHDLLLGNHFPPHAALVRRAAVMEAGIWDPSLCYYEDWDLWLRLAALGHTFVRSEGVGVGYRQHPDSATRNLERMRRGAMAVLDKANRYHTQCAACRAGIRHGRWNVRRHFLATVLRSPALQQSRRASVGERFRTLLAAWLRDPLLPVVYGWDGLRALKAGLRGQRRERSAT